MYFYLYYLYIPTHRRKRTGPWLDVNFWLKNAPTLTLCHLILSTGSVKKLTGQLDGSISKLLVQYKKSYHVPQWFFSLARATVIFQSGTCHSDFSVWNGNYLVNHSIYIDLVDPKGEFMEAFGHSWWDCISCAKRNGVVDIQKKRPSVKLVAITVMIL